MKLKNFENSINKMISKIIKEEVEKEVNDNKKYTKKDFNEAFNNFMRNTMGDVKEKQKITLEQCGKIMEEIAAEQGLDGYNFVAENYDENTQILKGAIEESSKNEKEIDEQGKTTTKVTSQWIGYIPNKLKSFGITSQEEANKIMKLEFINAKDGQELVRFLEAAKKDQGDEYVKKMVEFLKKKINTNNEVKETVKQVSEQLKNKKKLRLTESELIEMIEQIIDESDEYLNIDIIKEEERPIIATIINRYTGTMSLTEATETNLGGYKKQFVLKAIAESMDKLNPVAKKIAKSVVRRIENNIVEQETPNGMKEYSKATNKSGEFNEDNEKEVAKKMKEYTKDMGDKNDNKKEFPKQNGGEKKAEQVEDSEEQEFIEDMKGGMHNLEYDREPEGFEDRVVGQLEGDKLQGNAQVDEDGNPLGNVVPTETGKKFNDTRKRKGLAKEKDKHYKKAPQPVVDGDKEELSESVIKDMEKIQHLTEYNKKTQ